MTLRVGQLLRYPRLPSPTESEIDGLANFFYETATPNCPTKCMLERGINTTRLVAAPDGRRRPAVLIRSSPHKVGSATTPWQDVFEVDSGHIRYFGDNKTPGRDPSLAPGNSILLEEFAKHQSGDPSVRSQAAPLVFFRAVPHAGKAKGHVLFQGFGIIESAERISQFDQRRNQYFANYQFDFAVFRMDAEHEGFDWTWIAHRRTSGLDLSETLASAPQAWRRWVKLGASGLTGSRRSVSRLMTRSTAERTPPPKSREADALQTIYEYFDFRKHSFELLALKVVAQILEDTGCRFHEGWITPKGGDKGVDFIGRLDLGSGFSTAKLVVLGQAKCVAPNRPTSGLHLSRTVSRLRRGWLGAFVTTSPFSEPAQAEVIDDKYPILLVDGVRLSRETLALTQHAGFSSVSEYLDELIKTYPSRIRSRQPEEILLD